MRLWLHLVSNSVLMHSLRRVKVITVVHLVILIYLVLLLQHLMGTHAHLLLICLVQKVHLMLLGRVQHVGLLTHE
jgi:hypothetical protein